MSADGPRIEITINKKGDVKIEPFGIPGGACHSITEAYDRLYGPTISVETKSEAYEEPFSVELKSQQK